MLSLLQRDEILFQGNKPAKNHKICKSRREGEWIFVPKTGHSSTSTGNDNSVIRPCTSGPKFFPSNWFGSSSIDERSSWHEDLALPSTDDPDYDDALPDEVQTGLPVIDEAFEAMLQSFDQDALEAEPVSLDILPHDEIEESLEHDEEEGVEEEPLGEPLGEETKA